MVCKEDVISWFKDAAAFRRIDVMCSLLNMCIPFELRFLGTCIEELGKHDYQELRGAAITANDMDKLARELSTSKGILETSTRHRLTVYLSLLQSHNYRCANWLYCTVLRNETLDTLLGNVLKDNNLHTELLLLFTMALNHPAFTFEQKSYFGDIIARLSEPELPQQAQNPTCPSGLGYFKSPLPVHHMSMMLKPGQPHIDLPGPPGIPVQTVNAVTSDFMAPPPPTIWPRPHYISAGCPLPPTPVELAGFQHPGSPLVSQTSSPSHSRSVSPSKIYPIRPPTHLPVMDRIPPIVKDNITNVVFQPDFKTVPNDEVELEKAPWLDSISLPPNIKIPNGLLTVLPNKLQPPLPANYLANELQQLKLDETLQCLSSSASSHSSDSQTPPDTPTDPAIQLHGPGRGNSLNGGNLPPGLPPPPPPSHELYANCSVPYTNQQYQMPQFTNRSLFFSQSYRPTYPPGDFIYNPFHYPYVPVPYSSGAVPQIKATCYNCGLSGHTGPDCKESTIEEITQKTGYQLDYKTQPESSADKPHSTLQ